MNTPGAQLATLDYQTPVQKFRPAILTAIAVAGMVLAIISLGSRMRSWINAYGAPNQLAIPQLIWFYLGPLAEFLIGLVMLGSSMCCLSLKPWARRGMLIYAYSFLIWRTLDLLLDISARDQLFVQLMHPTLLSPAEWWFISLAIIAVLHAIATPFVIALPAVKTAFEIGRDYDRASYTSAE